MGKTLILTEKPSVAKEYASVLGVRGSGEGCIENEKYVITWCVGHLVEMCYPEKYDEKYKKWNIQDLPFLPEKYKYEVINDVKKQYKVVHDLMHRKDIDKMLYCGDSGREGEVIGRLIRNYGGVAANIKEYRVWIDSFTEAEIKRGIASAKPLSEYDKLADAGIMRGIEDYAMGINLSRALSCIYGKRFNDVVKSDKWKSISVGRVMTCVLGMVVKREREIRNFTETVFYKPIGSFDGINSSWTAREASKYYALESLYKDIGFLKRDAAEKFTKDIKDKPVKIEDMEILDQKKKAPLLFNLAELQNECSKRYKISPNETLEIAQELYEKKLTTYPRTDARVLSTAVAVEIQKNIQGLCRLDEIGVYAKEALNGKEITTIAKSGYTDDSKITDHYAIIPTGEVSGLSSLSELTRNVYTLIVKRFLSIFYPAAVYSSCKVDFIADGEKIQATSKVLKTKGYLSVWGVDEGETDGESQNLADYISKHKKGDTVKTTMYSVAEGKTTPPKRYTSGSMVLAMENAGKLIDDSTLREQIAGAGIGTSATRAGIIEKLVKIGYLVLNKKTQIITPHADGEAVYDIVNQTIPDFLSPEMTAKWETKLSEIESGTLKGKDYEKEIYDYVRKKVEEIKSGTASMPEASKENTKNEGKKESIGKCPVCGKSIHENRQAYSCEDSECGFALWKNDYFFANKKKELTKDVAKALLKNGSMAMKGLYSEKKNKTYDATVKMVLDGKKAKFELKFD